MEDAARFGLDDAGLSERLKGLRHGLRLALEQPVLDRGLLLAARDVEGDVGTAISTPGEMRRHGLAGIAAAAAARLTEALRSIEEAAKALGADASAFETLRYGAYTCERDLLLALGTGRCPQWRLCVLITESLCKRPWLDVAMAAVDGGADCIQLREKELESAELLARATRLADAAGDTALVVNDRPDIALLASAAGVHLGQTDMPVASARQLAGFRLLLGVSTANLEQARAAARAGADYCGVGPMFTTTTKHKPVLSGPEYLRAYLADPITSQRPHLAIGGINPDNVQRLWDVGCRGVAVSSVVCGADDPAAICRSLIRGCPAPASAPV